MLASETIIASSTIASSTQNVASATLPPLPPGEEIYDILATIPMGFPWLYILGRLALVVVILSLIIVFYKWLTKPVVRKRVTIIQSPETQAIRAIKRLKFSEVWENRDVKSICETAAAILKNYTQDAYNIGLGAASTTDEYLIALIDGSVKNEILANIKDMLEYCDEIRYTGSDDTRIKPEELIERIEKLINTRGWRK